MERLKVKALSLNSSTAKKKKKNVGRKNPNSLLMGT
jgi:hypothetical protein